MRLMVLALMVTIAIVMKIRRPVAFDIGSLKHQVLTVPSKTFPNLVQLPGPNKPMLKGHVARPFQFPYQAALFIDGTKFCGASLISRKFILTAAHCVQGASTIDIILGAHRIYSPESTQVRYTSKTFIVHKGWDPNILVNDIALIKLPTPAPYTVAIRPIVLPSRADVKNNFVGCMSIISGWGKNSDKQTGITESLQYVETQVISNAQCAKYFGAYITKSNICCSGEGNKSTCNGDSGGPMVIKIDGRAVQVGITSFVSNAGCEAGYPHAYTRITEFLDWLEKNAEIHIRRN